VVLQNPESSYVSKASAMISEETTLQATRLNSARGGHACSPLSALLPRQCLTVGGSLEADLKALRIDQHRRSTQSYEARSEAAPISPRGSEGALTAAAS
jgi:hypothetical protein